VELHPSQHTQLEQSEMYAEEDTCKGDAGAGRKNIFWEFPAGETLKGAHRRIPPEFFRTAACTAFT
jgi:hypothetical protein